MVCQIFLVTQQNWHTIKTSAPWKTTKKRKENIKTEHGYRAHGHTYTFDDLHISNYYAIHLIFNEQCKSVYGFIKKKKIAKK